MGSEVLLKSACELSYQIARDGVEADPPVDPPAAMRSFLYVADLPSRALTVAQQAIEDDPAFRRRVAEHADEAEVGRAGYLWLHRPIGWAAEFEELSNEHDDTQIMDDGEDEGYGADDLSNEVIDDPDATSSHGDYGIDDGVTVSEPAYTGTTDLFAEGDDDYDTGVEVPAGAASALGFGSIDAFSNGDSGLDLSLASDSTGRSEANAIEDELSSLRGLVDRLSSERKAVSTSVRRVEAEVETSKHQPSMFDSDIYTLQSELESARAELDAARAERDTAVHQRSESLTRQLELEKELERSRELRAELEREHEDSDTAMVELRESLARTEASLTNLESERDELRTQAADLTETNEALNTQIARVSEEKESQTKALQADYSALQAETEGLRIDRDDLTAKVSESEVELEEVKSQLSQSSAQAGEAKSLVDALTEEKIDLASRLADTEAMLETTRIQLSAVKSDSEAVTADLSNIKAHRDGLALQVDELHNSLTEALNDLAKVRSTSDADRAALKEVRSERDLLRVRVGSLEQIESGMESKLSSLTAERDSLVVKADEAQAELTQTQRDLRTVEGERDQLTEELAAASEAKNALTAEHDETTAEADRLRGQAAELEATRDGLQQQVEQLNEENSSIQSQLVEAERLRNEAAENQGHALSELAQRLSAVENERARLEGDLREAEGRLSDALVTLEAARDEAERIRQSTVDASPGPKMAPEPAAAETEAPPADDEDTTVVADEGEASADTETEEEARSIFGDAVVEDEDTQPPPPLLDEDAPDDTAEEKAAVPPEETRTGRRHVWGLGALRRGEPEATEEGTAQPPPPVASDAAGVGSASGSLADEGDIDDVAAALAETLQDGKSETTSAPPVTDEEIDSISSELAEAVDSAGLESAEHDEDLDEISNLIAQTVTDFDPKSIEQADFDDDQIATDEPKTGRARRLFGSRSDDDSKRTSGPLPPSVFGATSDPDDPALAALLEGSGPNGPADITAAFPADGTTGEMGKAVGARRQIDVPAEVADDEIEMARHVVSSPDVVLLVDGDSVAKMGWPSLPVAQQRDALVSYLADLAATSGAAPDVVFDGRIGEEESLPASRAVRIRLSTPPTEPAAALDELVDAYPEQWPIAIVTDDAELGRSAVERGAVVLNNGQLLDLFIA
ncbi:MAG: hypothetical protein OEV40_00735 [Acidimicrobiia bacterium]|nr:hypothetical protein [Acidimicrobiia bacterium]